MAEPFSIAKDPGGPLYERLCHKCTHRTVPASKWPCNGCWNPAGDMYEFSSGEAEYASWQPRGVNVLPEARPEGATDAQYIADLEYEVNRLGLLLTEAGKNAKAAHPGDALGRCFDCAWAGNLECSHAGVLGTGSAAGHSTSEFSNLSNQAHGYGVTVRAPTKQEDAFLQRAVRESSKLVAPGKLAAGVQVLPEPFATLHDDGHWTMPPGKESYKSRFAGWWAEVYSAEQLRAALGVLVLDPCKDCTGCPHCGGSACAICESPALCAEHGCADAEMKLRRTRGMKEAGNG